MARTPEYQLGNAIVNPGAAEAVREIFDRPELPPPPTADHPMTAFAQKLLAPMMGTAMPTADEAGTSGGIRLRTRNDVFVRPQPALDIGKFFREEVKVLGTPLGRLGEIAGEVTGIASRQRASAIDESINS